MNKISARVIILYFLMFFFTAGANAEKTKGSLDFVPAMRQLETYEKALEKKNFEVSTLLNVVKNLKDKQEQATDCVGTTSRYCQPAPV